MDQQHKPYVIKSMRVDPDDWEIIEMLARAQNLTTSEVVRQLIAAYLRRGAD